MKFFHLADLHFGKNIHGYSLIDTGDQPFFVEQVLKKAEEHKPDAILISGDVYDRAVPSKEAVRLFDDFLTELTKRKIKVMIIAGNHDSGSRLAFAHQILCHQDIYIAGEVTEKVYCKTLTDAYGPVHFWLVPYLFPAAVNMVLKREDLREYDEAMRALLEVQSINFEERNVILAHQFVIVGEAKPVMGGSETTVGGIGQIDTKIFERFDYTALGHIHNAQCMGRETIRYAGSPLCYHFSEEGQCKGLTIVELLEKGMLEIKVEELQVLHTMTVLMGTMEELLESEPKAGCYIKAVITQEFLPPRAVETLRTYFEAKDCILMEITREFSGVGKKKEGNQVQDVKKHSLEQLFCDFYSEQYAGEVLEQSLEKIVMFTAEQTRHGFEDESEKEHREAMEALIAYAASCNSEEEVL